MKVVAIIPARFNSQRFPGKLMEKIGGKELILFTYQNILKTKFFDEVIVATDDKSIFDLIENNGGKAQITAKNHESGSDRIAEVAKNVEADIIVNVQGDEPFIKKEDLESLINIFKNDTEKEIDLASLMEEIKFKEDIENPNNVKVVTDHNGNALYFSRSVIPFDREIQPNTKYYKHIGIYAFRREALLSFSGLKRGFLESTEKLEQLRYLENGYKIRLAISKNPTIGIDTPEDLEKAKEYLKTIKHD